MSEIFSLFGLAIFMFVYYGLPFLIVLAISYGLASVVLRKVRHRFARTKDVAIFAFSLLLIITALLSAALAVDLIFKIPYRPIEFMGEPFWIPNIVLSVLSYFFSRRQVKLAMAGPLLAPTNPKSGKAIARIALICAVLLLIVTRIPYFDAQYKNPTLQFVAGILHAPALCEYMDSYDDRRSNCVRDSSRVSSSGQVEQCEYFASQSEDRVACVSAKAVRQNAPQVCREFEDASVYGLKFYETYRCMSQFVGTDEWELLCKTSSEKYPNYPGLPALAQCPVEEQVEPVGANKISESAIPNKAATSPCTENMMYGFSYYVTGASVCYETQLLSGADVASMFPLERIPDHILQEVLPGRRNDEAYDLAFDNNNFYVNSEAVFSSSAHTFEMIEAPRMGKEGSIKVNGNTYGVVMTGLVGGTLK